MYKEIIEKYGKFSDSWIKELRFIQRYDSNFKQIEVFIYCSNKSNDFKYELIKIIFGDVKEFQINGIENKDIFSIDEVYTIESGEIIFDFDPIDYFDYLKENADSKFKIKAYSIKYEYIEDYNGIN